MNTKGVEELSICHEYKSSNTNTFKPEGVNLEYNPLITKKYVFHGLMLINAVDFARLHRNIIKKLKRILFYTVDKLSYWTYILINR